MKEICQYKIKNGIIKDKIINVDQKDIYNICEDPTNYYRLKEFVNKLYHDKLNIFIYQLPQTIKYTSFIGAPLTHIYENLNDVKSSIDPTRLIENMNMNIYINLQKTLCYFKFGDNLSKYLLGKYKKFYFYDYFKDLIEDIELYNKMKL